MMGTKDLLILSGEGRDAELYRQVQVGGERDHTAMKTIYYHPQDQQDGKRQQGPLAAIHPASHGKWATVEREGREERGEEAAVSAVAKQDGHLAANS